MERAEWLKKVRGQAESLYDLVAPAYWVKFGFYPNATHRLFIDKLLAQMEPHSAILDAGCGAGRYDGLLLRAGHSVLGIDQSERMLARAREHFPEGDHPGLRYQKLGLQEIDFNAAFDAIICVDAMEHVPPEDWPGIMARFQKALKPGGWLYLTVEAPDWSEVGEAYERARSSGLPVVFGEVVDRVDGSYNRVMGLDPQEIRGGEADGAVYHYHPSLEQARAWLAQIGLGIEEEAIGDGYAHLLARRAR